MARRLFMRFTRTAYVMDLRPAESTLYHRALRFERKHKTAGKPSNFGV